MFKKYSENRIFKDEWTEQYLFILPATSTKPMCTESVALVKSANVNHHYNTRHGTFDQMYPLNTEVRTNKIHQLKTQYETSTKVLVNSLIGQQHAMECSLRIHVQTMSW